MDGVTGVIKSVDGVLPPSWLALGHSQVAASALFQQSIPF